MLAWPAIPARRSPRPKPDKVRRPCAAPMRPKVRPLGRADGAPGRLAGLPSAGAHTPYREPKAAPLFGAATVHRTAAKCRMAEGQGALVVYPVNGMRLL